MIEPHRHVKFMTAEIELQPDGTVKPVAVVYTDLGLNNLTSGYDAAAVEELVGRIKIFQKTYHQPVRLRTML